MKKYLPLFILSSLLIYPIGVTASLIIGMTGFGNGPVKLVTIFVSMGVIAFVLGLAYLNKKLQKASYVLSLLAILFPIGIMMTILSSWNKKSMSYEQFIRDRNTRFIQNSAKELPLHLTVKDVTYTLTKHDTAYYFMVHANTIIQTPFNTQSLSNAVNLRELSWVEPEC